MKLFRKHRGMQSLVLFGLVVSVTVLFILTNICNNGLFCLNSTKHSFNDHNVFKDDHDVSEVLRHIPSKFNMEEEDVLVFLHIQKTGGTTFGRHLVNNLDLEKPCICTKFSKKCDCLTKKKTLWLFSRYSTGWACGLHADWTELKNCVDHAMDKQEKGHRSRRYHYITILRDPVLRYLSEFRHVQRGATWKTARLFCNGRQATLEEVPFCYKGETWENVDIDSFMKCKFNLANNRQTRMLANLSKINCYNKTGLADEERDKLMLESAKENLQNFSFFGLTEFQTETQFLFENTFNLKFIDDFEQLNTSQHNKKLDLDQDTIDRIRQLNHLDLKLYSFAEKLFLQRYKAMNLKVQQSENTNAKVIDNAGKDKDEDIKEEKEDDTEEEVEDEDTYNLNGNNERVQSTINQVDIQKNKSSKVIYQTEEISHDKGMEKKRDFVGSNLFPRNNQQIDNNFVSQASSGIKIKVFHKNDMTSNNLKKEGESNGIATNVLNKDVKQQEDHVNGRLFAPVLNMGFSNDIAGSNLVKTKKDPNEKLFVQNMENNKDSFLSKKVYNAHSNNPAIENESTNNFKQDSGKRPDNTKQEHVNSNVLGFLDDGS